MTMTDQKAPSGGAGREAVEALVACGGLDGLFEQINSGQVALTGSDGLLPALLKETLERGLQAELTDHLGYDKGERAPAARGNARNGSSVKTMDSEVGPFETCGPSGPCRHLHAPSGAQRGQPGHGAAWTGVSHHAWYAGGD